MFIVKASGEKEKFNKRKVERTARRAGASKSFAREVANKVSKEVHEGMSTKEILKIALKFLRKEKAVAEKYSLKTALMQLGPTGFPFEHYFAKVLEHYGYKTKVGVFLKGKKVMQEIDILATKDNKINMIECKYHNAMGNNTDLKVAMYTYARFLDVKKYAQYPWLVTNTKCTHSAIAYASGVGLKVIGWSYPSEGNLQDLIEKKGLYPVTALLSVKGIIKDNLARAKISLVKEIADLSIDDLYKRTRISKETLIKIKKDAEDLINQNKGLL
jgi:hypothetical protein